MADLVTDISLVAGWNPRLGESPAEVFIYTKITPQPAAKVSLLHLQSLVVKTTLLRIIPLLPDGSSPRGSPGIRALGIPVVAGRNRAAPQTPVELRKLSEITLDGAESDAPNEVTPDDSIRMVVTRTEAGVKNGPVLKQVEGRRALRSSAIGSPTPSGSSGSQKGNLGMPGNPNGSIIMKTSDDEDVFSTSLRGLSPSGIYSSSDFWRRHRDGSLASDMIMSYSRDANGNFKPEFLDKSGPPSETRNYGKKIKVFPTSPIQIGLSPIIQKPFERIVELHAPAKDIHPGGQDGTTEDLESVLRASESAAESAAAAKEHSSVNSDDGIPVEGEMVKQVAPEAGESEDFELDEIRMTIEQDTLFICFPGNIRGDAVVVEIMLEVKPLCLEGKPYVTFIFAGLPRCDNGAYINFRIYDEDDWKFDTFPEISALETQGSQGNKLRGILELAGDLHLAASNRSLIIRALRRPMVLEVLDFRMKIDITASFSWSSTSDRIESKFEINIAFLDLKLDDDASRSMINFYLVNGPETQDDMTIDSPEGVPPQFVLGDLVFETLEVGARRCRLLRVERPTRDARQPLRIRFNKQLGLNPKEIDIPSVHAGGKATLSEESIAIMKPRLPLEVIFSPNSTSWKETDKPGTEVPTRFTRTGMSMGEASPSVIISCLNPVMSSVGGGIDLALMSGDGFIDRISYEIEESESFSNRGTPMVALRMSFGIYIPVGLGSMEEIVRIHIGSFGFGFATINNKLAGKGVLFEDGDELLVLNRGIIKGDGCKEILLIGTEWFGEQSLELSCGEMEFRLPRVMARVVGRTDFECGNRQARIVSRTQNPNSNNINGISRFTKSKVIISGMDTSKNEIFLQIPYEKGQGVPRARTGKQSGPNSSPRTIDRSLTPSLLSMSVTSFHSILEEDLESAEKKPQEESETPAYDKGNASRDTSSPHWIWNTKEIVIIILVVLALCFKIITQSARNSALKTSLRHTRAILEERERIINQKPPPPDYLSPRFQPQRLQNLGQGSEDIWWSVVGSGDSQDIGHLTIGVVAMDSSYADSNCDVTNSITNGERPPSGEKHVNEVESGQKAGKVHDEDLQKRLVGVLLEDNPLVDRAQHVLIKVFSFFWSLVFGV